jgi:hypothetical protein
MNSIDRGVEVLGAGSGTGLTIDGNAAHDDPDVGNPIKFGGRAHTSTPAAVGNNDRVNAYFDEYGRLHVFDENGSSAAAGDVAHDAVDSGNPVKMGARARSSQIAATANDDRTDLIANLYGELGIAGYDWTLNALRKQEINPLSEQYAPDDLVDNNISVATNYHYIDMAGYRYFSIQGETSGATPTDVLTVTVEATNRDDGTAAASCKYQDVTNTLYGVASWVDTNFFAISDTPTAFKYVRVKYTVSGGTNDANLTLYIKKMH